jgi:hypothetical protein
VDDSSAGDDLSTPLLASRPATGWATEEAEAAGVAQLASRDLERGLAPNIADRPAVTSTAPAGMAAPSEPKPAVRKACINQAGAACISGRASVLGDVSISGDASISGGASQSGAAHDSGSPPAWGSPAKPGKARMFVPGFHRSGSRKNVMEGMHRTPSHPSAPELVPIPSVHTVHSHSAFTPSVHTLHLHQSLIHTLLLHPAFIAIPSLPTLPRPRPHPSWHGRPLPPLSTLLRSPVRPRQHFLRGHFHLAPRATRLLPAEITANAQGATPGVAG